MRPITFISPTCTPISQDVNPRNLWTGKWLFYIEETICFFIPYFLYLNKVLFIDRYWYCFQSYPSNQLFMIKIISTSKNAFGTKIRHYLNFRINDKKIHYYRKVRKILNGEVQKIEKWQKHHSMIIMLISFWHF